MKNRIDMKVLRVIHTLVNSGSVSKTAELLDVSPGAISYMLKKARKVTDSSLFLRTGTGMMPNHIAIDLSQRYESICKELYGKVDGPLESNHQISICTYSVFEFLLSTMFSENSDITNQLHFISPELCENNRLIRLRNKEVDIDIGTRLPGDRSIVQTLLFTGGIKVLARKNHPLLKGHFSIDKWLQCRHVRWSRRMDFVCDDFSHANRFYELMNQRKISVVSSDSLNMALLCAFSDDVMLMPTIVANLLTKKLPVEAHTPPPELEMQFDCYLHYHHSLAQENRIREIVNILQNYVTDL